MSLHKTKNVKVAVVSVLILLAAFILVPSQTVFAQNVTGTCEGSIDSNNCSVTAYLAILINVLSALVGVVIVIMIAVGGVQYSASKDNPQQAAAAKEHIRNAVLALLIFLFGVAFLQWLVPGGVF